MALSMKNCSDMFGLSDSIISISFRAHSKVVANRMACFLSSVIGFSARICGRGGNYSLLLPQIPKQLNRRRCVSGVMVVGPFSLPTKLLDANPTFRLNHRSSLYCDRPNLLCVRPHNKHCFWPGSHRNLYHEGVFVFCRTVRVFEFLPTQKRAGLRGELCALLVHRWVHKQPVLF